MSFCSSLPTARSNSLLARSLSFGVVAFGLVLLQGCALPELTTTGAREPGTQTAGLGRLGVDSPASVERQPVARDIDRNPPRERVVVRLDTDCLKCRR